MLATRREPVTARRELRAMGCGTELTVVADDAVAAGALLDRAVERLAHLEQRWSRFLPDSDITRVNLAPGREVHVDRTTVRLVEAMVGAWWATSGAFDPTLLGALVGLGDAASWQDPTRTSALPDSVSRRGAPEHVLVDPVHHLVQVPPGTVLDAGGIGKGLAADLLVEDLLAEGAHGAIACVGGDLRVGGEPHGADHWTLDVADPLDDARAIARVGLAAGGIATSAVTHRRWTTPDGEAVHHLIDPATGRPVTTRLIAATVAAGTAAWAEAWTKALMVRGTPLLAELDELGLAALAVRTDGRVVTNRAWARFAAPLPTDAPEVRP